jgi:hypothetical protein
MTKPEKRTLSIPCHGGTVRREVEAEVYGGWVAVHRTWAVGAKSPWVVTVLPAGAYVAHFRLKQEAKVLAVDVAEKYAHLGELHNDLPAFCEIHGLNQGPIGPARKLVGYERCYIGHREVWSD